MDQKPTYGILDRDSLIEIEGLDKITDELSRIVNDLVGDTKELIEDFLDFVRDEREEYIIVKCGTLSKLRKSGKISHGNGSLREKIIKERNKSISRNPSVEKIGSDNLNNLVISLKQEDPISVIEQLTPYLIVSEEFEIETLETLLKLASKAENIKPLFLLVLLEMLAECPKISIDSLPIIFSRTERVNKNHIDMLMEVLMKEGREKVPFDKVLECFNNGKEIYPKSLAMLSRYALSYECGDVSPQLRDLAKKYNIAHSKQFSKNLGNLKRRNN